MRDAPATAGSVGRVIRTLPPRGRAAGSILLVAFALSLLVAVPASAAGDVSVSTSGHVTGRDPLVITPGGLPAPVALTVKLTDSAGAAATWRFTAATVANGQPLSLDLSAPDSGSPPRNGTAAVVLTAAGETVASVATVIDRTPPVPALQSVVRGQRVGLTWNAVSAADAVTYRLERIATGGAWTTVQEGESAGGYTDRDLEPGRYRYRLSAALPAAGGGRNWSVPSAVQVKIAAPAPTPPPTPATAKPAATPAETKAAAAKPKPKASEPRKRPRSVAATGTVRGPVVQDGLAVRTPDPTPSISMAHEPAVDGSALSMTSGAPAVAAPEAAGPATAAPQVATPEVAPPPLQPFPVTVPPAGSLAVQAATRTPPDPATLLTGLVFLMLAAAVGFRLRGREALRLIQAWVGRR